MTTLEFTGPKKVPVLKANNMCRGTKDKRGQRLSLEGWCAKVFSNPTSYVAINNAIKSVWGFNALEIDSRKLPRNVQADIWNRAVCKLGYDA